jgi:allantoin racemase
MKILLINPNTTQAVTDAVLVAARAAAAPDTELLAVTGTFGPVVIGSRAENALAQHSVLALAAQHAPGCDAVILAVSLDTALWACRELLSVPVVGMTEAGLLVGATVAPRIGVLTYGHRMAPLYRELVESYGLRERLAGVAAIDVSPEQTFTDPEAVEEMVLRAAQKLVDHDGAEAVVLAGAVMAAMAARLQPRLAVPLLDGVGCAVSLAESLVRLRLPKARVGSVSATGGRAVQGVDPALTALFARSVA